MASRSAAQRLLGEEIGILLAQLAENGELVQNYAKAQQPDPRGYQLPESILHPKGTWVHFLFRPGCGGGAVGNPIGNSSAPQMAGSCLARH